MLDFPKLLEIKADVLSHFDTTPEVPFFLLAGSRSGKTTLALDLIESGMFGETFILAHSRDFAREIYGDLVARKNLISQNSFRHAQDSEILKTLLGSRIEKGPNPRLLVVEDYLWLSNSLVVDGIIKQALELKIRVLILSTQGRHEGAYKPTARYSTWDINNVLDSRYYSVPLKEDPLAFKRDFGGGTPYVEKLAPVSLDLAILRIANLDRQEEWCPDQKPDASFRSNELNGEVGEVIDAIIAHAIGLANRAGKIANIIKKLERTRLGWRGRKASIEDLEDELGDLVVCTDLTAITCGIDLAAATKRKFNKTSIENGLSTLI